MCAFFLQPANNKLNCCLFCSQRPLTARPPRPALLLCSASLPRSSVGSRGYYFFHLQKIHKKLRLKKRGGGETREEDSGGRRGRAHAAAVQENCESFEGTDRCHLHVSAVHVAGKRGGGSEEGGGGEGEDGGGGGGVLICSHISIQKK